MTKRKRGKHQRHADQMATKRRRKKYGKPKA